MLLIKKTKGKSMNKIISATLIGIGLLSTSVMAECTKELCTKPEKDLNLNAGYVITTKDSAGKEFYLNITDIKKDVHIGLSSVNVQGDRAADWTAGIGIGATVADSIYIGANLDAEYVNVFSNSLMGITGEIKSGIVLDKENTVYGLIGVKSMSYDHGTNGVGLGYGIGVEHKLCPKTAVAAEYKVYDMTLEGSNSDYNHESLGLKVKYFF